MKPILKSPDKFGQAEPYATYEEEESADLRRQYFRHALRLAIAFAALFAAVYLTFWWSGAAVRFGASRVADRGTPTWHIIGTVRNAATHSPVPWASIADDPAGRPPFFHTDADQAGAFELVTLAEPHRIRISAAGYRTSIQSVGRAWFLWQPSGKEQYEVELTPE